MDHRTFFVKAWESCYIPGRKLRGCIAPFLFFLVFSVLGIPPAWGGSAKLTWDPNPALDLAGYTVYYGISSKIYDQAVNVGKTTTHNVTGLLDGVTYYFALKAYDTTGNQSSFSEEIPFVSGDLPVVIGPVASVVVSPSSATIAAGANQQFAAVAKDAQGIQIPDVIYNWNSSDSSLAIITSTGLATAIKGGATMITASSNGVVSNQASLQATSPAASPSPVLTAIEVNPSSVNLEVGKTWQFTGKAKDSSGIEMLGEILTWNSSSTNVVSINSLGLVTALSPGTATITAYSGSVVSNQSIVQVATIPLQETFSDNSGGFSIEVLPSTALVPVLENMQFTAVAMDHKGIAFGGVGFIWDSTNPDVAQVDSLGKVTGFSVGTSQIMASGDGINSNQALVQVTHPLDTDFSEEGPVVGSIVVSPPSVMVSKNSTQQFAAVVKDPAGAQISKPDLTWSSSNHKVAVVDHNGVATAIASGSATITALSKLVISNSGVLTVKKIQSSTSGGGCGFVKIRGGRPPDMRQIGINLMILFAPLAVSGLYKWAQGQQKVEAFGVWNGLKLSAVSLSIFMVSVYTAEAFTVMSSAI